MNSKDCALKLFNLSIVAALVNLTFVSLVDITQMDQTLARFLVLICGLISIVVYLGYEKLKKKVITLLNTHLSSDYKELDFYDHNGRLDISKPENEVTILKERIKLLSREERDRLIDDIQDD